MNQAKDTSFGLRLRKVFQGSSNKEIAHKLGVTKSAITYYMNGRIPSAEMLTNISRITGCSIHWLITGQGHEELGVSRVGGEHRANTIMLANMVGGVARSTSAVMLAVEFGGRGRRTLLVDTPRGDSTFLLLHPLLRRHLWEDLSPAYPLTKLGVRGRVFFQTPFRSLDLCSANERHQMILNKEHVKSFPLDLSTISQEYPLIVLDTPSHTDPFATAEFFMVSMLTSVHVLIPVVGDYVSFSVLEHILEMLQEAQKYTSNVSLMGVFLTRHTFRNYQLHGVLNELNKIVPNKVLSTTIPENVALGKLRSGNFNNFIQQNSRGAIAYKSLADEVLTSINETAT